MPGDPLPGAPYQRLAGRDVAGDSPQAASEIERVNAKRRPEAETEIMQPTVTAILPHRGRAAERHHQRVARFSAPELSAFGGRRLAAGDTGQGADELPMSAEAALGPARGWCRRR